MKDILVHLDGTSEDETRLRTAEAIASVLQSHITGLFTNPLPDYAAYAPMDGGAAAAGLLVQIQEDTRQRGNQIEQKFVERFGKLGVSNEVRRIEDLPGLLSSRVVSDARCGDLFVIGQPYRDEPKLNWDDLFEAVLFGSGRGVLVVPPNKQPADAIRRVLVCWRDSREAARAVAEATPIIRKATRTGILLVDPRSETDGIRNAPAADIARHLGRYGTAVEINLVESEGRSVGAVILDQARRMSADLIVMGGYGHSRAREWIMGGATRDVLAASEYPILIAH